MSDIITLTGIVATIPRHLVTSEGLPITSFRLASTQRRYDRAKGEWVDGDTNWYTITTFRQLAAHSAASIAKGERVVVTGKLRIREWQNGERTGTTIEIDAEALGHDLAWGTSTFTRSISSSSAAKEDPTAEFTTDDEAAPDSGDAVVSDIRPSDDAGHDDAGRDDAGDDDSSRDDGTSAPAPLAVTPF
jgi:single-strand DNA-binding protein